MDLDQFLDGYVDRATRRLPTNAQSVTREVPTRAPSVTGDVLAPFLIALITALVVFLAVGTVAIAAKWKVTVPLVVAGLALAAVWLGHLSKGWDRLIWAVEDITGVDVNRDGDVGQPITHFELPTGPQSFRFGELHLAPELLIEWCQAAWDRQSLAYSAWEPRFALPDGTQGRERYQQFRQELVKEGFAEEVGGNVGLRPLWRNPEAVAFIGGFAHVHPDDGTPLLKG